MRTLFENRTISPLKHRAEALVHEQNMSHAAALNRIAVDRLKLENPTFSQTNTLVSTVM